MCGRCETRLLAAPSAREVWKGSLWRQAGGLGRSGREIRAFQTPPRQARGRGCGIRMGEGPGTCPSGPVTALRWEMGGRLSLDFIQSGLQETRAVLQPAGWFPEIGMGAISGREAPSRTGARVLIGRGGRGNLHATPDPWPCVRLVARGRRWLEGGCEGLPLRARRIRVASDWPRGERLSSFECTAGFPSVKVESRTWSAAGHGTGMLGVGGLSNGEAVRRYPSGLAVTRGIMWPFREGYCCHNERIGCQRCATAPFRDKIMHCRLGFRLEVVVARQVLS